MKSFLLLSYLSALPFSEAKRLLTDEEFLERCADEGIAASDALMMSRYTRAEKCSSPISIEKVHPETGDVSDVFVPCGSNDVNVCEECAEFKRRLRASQIMGTLDRSSVDVAFFTLTAPSFGKVHNTAWTAKDEYKARHLSDGERYRRRLTTMKKRKQCPCGDRHTFEDDRIGVPVGTYNYTKEVIWNENLPRLMKSAVRRLKYMAVQNHGIDKDSFRLFAVYERQKRGSLHAHILLVVDKNAYAFETLVSDIKAHWKSPTALIPDETVALYRSSVIADRFNNLNIYNGTKDKINVPYARWKGGEAVPATEFGEVYDIRIIEADSSEEDGELRTYKQAAGYVSKYLTKNQSAFSPKALKKLPARLRRHYAKFREVSAVLFTDLVVRGGAERGMEKRVAHLEELVAQGSIQAQTELALMNDKLRLLRSSVLQKTWIADEVMNVARREVVTREVVTSAVRGDSLPIDVTNLDTSDPFTFLRYRDASVRYIKMRMNRLANNAGFSGTLVLCSNWLHSLASMKRARIELFYATHPEAIQIDYLWNVTRDMMFVTPDEVFAARVAIAVSVPEAAQLIES